MLPRYRQCGDVHGDAAVHVERANQEETAAAHDGPGGNNAKVRATTLHPSYV